MTDKDMQRCKRYTPAIDVGCGDDYPEAYMEEDADGEYVALKDVEIDGEKDDVRRLAEVLAAKQWPLDHLPPRGSADEYEAALREMLKR